MKRSYYMVGIIMLTFFVISFLTNIIGPLIPDMITGFSLSLTLVAVLPFAFFIAYGVMSIPSGMLIEKYNEKKIMVAAFMVAFIGSLILAVFPNYLSALGSLFLIGCGMAMLQVVINPLLRTSGGEENYAFYSIMAQLIFGLASFISPLVYSGIVLNLNKNKDGNLLFRTLSQVVPANLPWISMYWLFTLICLVMIGIILVSRFPKVELTSAEKPEALSIYIQLLKRRVVILFFIAMLCYVGTEQGVANWISQFLASYHGYDAQKTGAETVAYFWGLMTAGGVLGLLLVKLMDSRKVLILFSILAILCLSTALIRIRENGADRFPDGWIFCLRDVSDHILPGAEFSGRTSWFVFRHTGYRYHRRRYCAADHRLAGRSYRITEWNVFSLPDHGIHPEHRVLGKTHHYQ